MATKLANLSEAIDRLAVERAKEFQQQIAAAVQRALSPFWQVKNAGHHRARTDVENMIHAVLKHGPAVIQKQNMPAPSEELVAAFRSAVLNSILESVPAIEGIVRMSEEIISAHEEDAAES